MKARAIKMENGFPKVFTERLSKDVVFDMVLVEVGGFMMGSDDPEDWSKAEVG
jgi:hypothetical protein